MKSIYIYIAIICLYSCQPSQSKYDQSIPKNSIAKRLDSCRYFMQNVNSAYVIYIDSNNRIYEKHWGKSNNYGQVNDTTIFEGASLSKTITCYLYWTLVKLGKLNALPTEFKLCNGGSVILPPDRLLRHSVRSTSICIVNSTKDSFKYSEDNYLFLQLYIEKSMGKNLEELAKQYVFKPLGMQHSTFIWNATISDYVDGYFQDQKMHRKMYQFKSPLSNGSLYTCARDLIIFARALRDSGIAEQVHKGYSKVHQYKHLKWGLGMGIDSTMGRDLLWQWGCNWSYNHILLYDNSRKDIIIGLTNSIIGAKRLRFTCNFLLNNELELFNYINWY